MDLSGKKILVVEDEALIAMLFEDILTELECQVVGPAFNVRKASELARAAEIDAAILDVNIGGEPIFSVAEILVERGIPLVFSSGYGATGLFDEWQNKPTLPKPFTADELATVLRGIILAPKGSG